MNIVYFLLPMALLLGGGFVVSFVMAAVHGQYDDLETPAHRLLLEDESVKTEPTRKDLVP